MTLKIHKIIVGMIETNCYIIQDEESKDAIIIDPGDNEDEIFEFINKHGIKHIPYIFYTHGHIDHVRANPKLKKLTNSKIAVHKNDVELIENGELCGATYLGISYHEHSPDIVIQDKDEFEFSGNKIKVIHTPGHTQGCVCYLIDNYLFSGDTLFKSSVGRTDLYGGNYEMILKSIKDKLFILPDETKVFPGHGPETTIGKEKNSNPFFI